MTKNKILMRQMIINHPHHLKTSPPSFQLLLLSSFPQRIFLSSQEVNFTKQSLRSARTSNFTSKTSRNDKQRNPVIFSKSFSHPKKLSSFVFKEVEKKFTSYFLMFVKLAPILSTGLKLARHNTADGICGGLGANQIQKKLFGSLLKK